MILHALNVAEEEIVADYMMTGKRKNRAVVEATKALIGVSPDYLAASFDSIKSTYGTTDAYLREAAGLDDGLKQKLREALVEWFQEEVV